MTKFLLAVLVIISFRSYAQDDFVITLQNDTVQGSIKYRSSRATLTFSDKKSGNSVEYSPAEIKGFLFSGQSYISLQDSVLGDLFVKVLAYGEVSLYAYKDIYFLAKEGMVQTIEKKEKIVNGITVEDKKYVGQFAVLVSGCEATNTQLSKLKFSPSEFIKLVDTYNNLCAKPPQSKASIAAGKKRNKIEKGIRIALVKGNIDYEGGGDFLSGTLSRVEYEPVVTYSVGGFINIFLSRNFSLQPEVLFTWKKAYAENARYGTVGTISEDFSMGYLQFPMSIRYQLDKKLQPYLFGAPLFGLVVVSDYYREIDGVSSEVELNQVEIGFKVGAGLAIPISGAKKIGIEYQFEKSQESVPRNSSSPKYVGNSIGLRFWF
jgi:Outer membrane protein beta-barrel domain